MFIRLKKLSFLRSMRCGLLPNVWEEWLEESLTMVSWYLRIGYDLENASVIWSNLISCSDTIELTSAQNYHDGLLSLWKKALRIWMSPQTPQFVCLRSLPNSIRCISRSLVTTFRSRAELFEGHGPAMDSRGAAGRRVMDCSRCWAAAAQQRTSIGCIGTGTDGNLSCWTRETVMKVRTEIENGLCKNSDLRRLIDTKHNCF